MLACLPPVQATTALRVGQAVESPPLQAGLEQLLRRLPAEVDLAASAAFSRFDHPEYLLRLDRETRRAFFLMLGPPAPEVRRKRSPLPESPDRAVWARDWSRRAARLIYPILKQVQGDSPEMAPVFPILLRAELPHLTDRSRQDLLVHLPESEHSGWLGREPKDAWRQLSYFLEYHFHWLKSFEAGAPYPEPMIRAVAQEVLANILFSVLYPDLNDSSDPSDFPVDADQEPWLSGLVRREQEQSAGGWSEAAADRVRALQEEGIEVTVVLPFRPEISQTSRLVHPTQGSVTVLCPVVEEAGIALRPFFSTDPERVNDPARFDRFAAETVELLETWPETGRRFFPLLERNRSGLPGIEPDPVAEGTDRVLEEEDRWDSEGLLIRSAREGDRMVKAVVITRGFSEAPSVGWPDQAASAVAALRGDGVDVVFLPLGSHSPDIFKDRASPIDREVSAFLNSPVPPAEVFHAVGYLTVLALQTASGPDTSDGRRLKVEVTNDPFVLWVNQRFGSYWGAEAALNLESNARFHETYLTSIAARVGADSADRILGEERFQRVLSERERLQGELDEMEAGFDKHNSAATHWMRAGGVLAAGAAVSAAVVAGIFGVASWLDNPDDTLGGAAADLDGPGDSGGGFIADLAQAAPDPAPLPPAAAPLLSDLPPELTAPAADDPEVERIRRAEQELLNLGNAVERLSEHLGTTSVRGAWELEDRGFVGDAQVERAETIFDLLPSRESGRDIVMSQMRLLGGAGDLRVWEPTLHATQDRLAGEIRYLRRVIEQMRKDLERVRALPLSRRTRSEEVLESFEAAIGVARVHVERELPLAMELIDRLAQAGSHLPLLAPEGFPSAGRDIRQTVPPVKNPNLPVALAEQKAAQREIVALIRRFEAAQQERLRAAAGFWRNYVAAYRPRGEALPEGMRSPFEPIRLEGLLRAADLLEARAVVLEAQGRLAEAELEIDSDFGKVVAVQEALDRSIENFFEKDHALRRVLLQREVLYYNRSVAGNRRIADSYSGDEVDLRLRNAQIARIALQQVELEQGKNRRAAALGFPLSNPLTASSAPASFDPLVRPLPLLSEVQQESPEMAYWPGLGMQGLGRSIFSAADLVTPVIPGWREPPDAAQLAADARALREATLQGLALEAGRLTWEGWFIERKLGRMEATAAYDPEGVTRGDRRGMELARRALEFKKAEILLQMSRWAVDAGVDDPARWLGPALDRVVDRMVGTGSGFSDPQAAAYRDDLRKMFREWFSKEAAFLKSNSVEADAWFERRCRLSVRAEQWNLAGLIGKVEAGGDIFEDAGDIWPWVPVPESLFAQRDFLMIRWTALAALERWYNALEGRGMPLVAPDRTPPRTQPHPIDPLLKPGERFRLARSYGWVMNYDHRTGEFLRKPLTVGGWMWISVPRIAPGQDRWLEHPEVVRHPESGRYFLKDRPLAIYGDFAYHYPPGRAETQAKIHIVWQREWANQEAASGWYFVEGGPTLRLRPTQGGVILLAQGADRDSPRQGMVLFTVGDVKEGPVSGEFLFEPNGVVEFPIPLSMYQQVVDHPDPVVELFLETLRRTQSGEGPPLLYRQARRIPLEGSEEPGQILSTDLIHQQSGGEPVWQEPVMVQFENPQTHEQFWDPEVRLRDLAAGEAQIRRNEIPTRGHPEAVPYPAVPDQPAPRRLAQEDDRLSPAPPASFHSGRPAPPVADRPALPEIVGSERDLASIIGLPPRREAAGWVPLEESAPERGGRSPAAPPMTGRWPVPDAGASEPDPWPGTVTRMTADALTAYMPSVAPVLEEAGRKLPVFRSNGKVDIGMMRLRHRKVDRRIGHAELKLVPRGSPLRVEVEGKQYEVPADSEAILLLYAAGGVQKIEFDPGSRGRLLPVSPQAARGAPQWPGTESRATAGSLTAYMPTVAPVLAEAGWKLPVFESDGLVDIGVVTKTRKVDRRIGYAALKLVPRGFPLRVEIRQGEWVEVPPETEASLLLYAAEGVHKIDFDPGRGGRSFSVRGTNAGSRSGLEEMQPPMAPVVAVAAGDVAAQVERLKKQTASPDLDAAAVAWAELGDLRDQARLSVFNQWLDVISRSEATRDLMGAPAGISRSARNDMERARNDAEPAALEQAVVFQLDTVEPAGFAPGILLGGGSVAVLTKTFGQAQGLQELVRDLKLSLGEQGPRGRLVVLSEEEFGGDRAAALGALAGAIPAGVTVERVPPASTLEAVEQLLARYGLTFQAGGLEAVRTTADYLLTLA